MKIRAVTGDIPPEKIGITLMHEHLLVDGTTYFEMPKEAHKRTLVDAPITLENRGEILLDYTLSRENLKLEDINLAVKELMEFKGSGGSVVVEVTPIGLGRDPVGLRKISVLTGVNIVCSTGFYIGQTHPSFIKKADIDNISDFIIKEIMEGISYPYKIDIKAGIIKGASYYPMSNQEKKVIKAEARAQKETGVPFTIHPPQRDFERKKKIWELEKLIDLIQEEGAILEKFYISHADDWCSDDRKRVDLTYLKNIMDRYPITLSFDKFGNEGSWDGWWPGALAFSDNQGVRAVTELCEQGYEKQIVLSHDVFSKLQLKKYGGWGYSHILEHIVPRLRFYGVTKKQIRTMLIDNPKRILTF
ncbi:MAG: phosphotriesterase family protein [Candidatus Heimdallarchaeaceae archaeon]